MNAFLAAGETLLKTTSLADCSLGERIKSTSPSNRARKKATARPRRAPSMARPRRSSIACPGLAVAEPRLRRLGRRRGARRSRRARSAVRTHRRLDRLVRALAGFRGAFLPLIHAHNRLPRLATSTSRSTARSTCARRRISSSPDSTTKRRSARSACARDARRAASDLGARVRRARHPRLHSRRRAAVVDCGRRRRAPRPRPRHRCCGLGRRSRRLRLRAHERPAVAGTRLRLGRAHAPAPARGAREVTRLFVDPFDAPETIAAMLPTHATHVFCCTECRRIVNAVQDGSGKDLSFNEIGLGLDAAHRRRRVWRSAHAVCKALRRLRCARPSRWKRRRARSRSRHSRRPRPPTCSRAICVRPRLRIYQRAKGAATPRTLQRCGATSRAASTRPARDGVRRRPARAHSDLGPRDPPLWRFTYSARCAVPGQDQPRRALWRRAVLHALRFSMLYDKERETLILETQPKPPPKSCRYCGRLESTGTAPSSRWSLRPWTTPKATRTPPPLRTCSYCPLHYRTWLHNSQRELPDKRNPLPHLGARSTVAGAESGKRSLTRPSASSAKRRRRRGERRSRRRSAVAKGRRSWR